MGRLLGTEWFVIPQANLQHDLKSIQRREKTLFLPLLWDFVTNTEEKKNTVPVDTILNKQKFCRKKKKLFLKEPSNHLLFCPNYRRSNILTPGLRWHLETHVLACTYTHEMETAPILTAGSKKQQHTLPKPKITSWPKPTTTWAVPEITTPHTASHGAGCKTQSMVSYRANSKTLKRQNPAFCPALSWYFCSLITLQTSVK